MHSTVPTHMTMRTPSRTRLRPRSRRPLSWVLGKPRQKRRPCVAWSAGPAARACSTSIGGRRRMRPPRFVEQFWSVSWDLRGQGPFDSTVITFPSLHITHERGDDGPRHGFPLPNTLVHGVVGRVFHTTISERGRVVGARFRPGGFTARFGRDATALTGRVQPVDNELFGGPIHLDDDVDAASARLDELVGDYAGELDPTYVSLTQLVDRIRDDDRLHRVEQVMQHSPWSARTTQRVFQRYVGCRSSGCCAATAYSRQHWRSRATLASTSPTSPSASAGTTRHTSSTTSAPCWAVLRAVMP